MSRRFLSLILSAVLLLILPASVAATPPPSELLTAGRVDEAIGALRNRLQTSPNDAEAHALLMRAYFALQRWDDAIAAGNKAVSLAPNNAQYHLWLGRAYGEKADHSSWTSAISLAKKTRVEFERAVALNSNSVAARTDLAEFYVDAPGFLGGGKDKAQAQAEAVRSLGQEPAAHWIKSKIAESDKKYDVAEQELRAAIQSSGSDPEFMLNLASFYRRRGRISDVEKTVNDAVQSASRSPHQHVLYDAAELLYRAGRNFGGAVDLLRSYIAAPNHSEDAPVFRAHYLMGTILEKMGNKPAAAEQYRAALTLASDFEPAQKALGRIQ